MITAAAILKDGIIYTGTRHFECIRKVCEATKIKPAGGTQGFIDDRGIFLDRVTAMEHAFACGQIKEKKIRLYSEDLW